MTTDTQWRAQINIHSEVNDAGCINLPQNTLSIRALEKCKYCRGRGYFVCRHLHLYPPRDQMQFSFLLLIESTNPSAIF